MKLAWASDIHLDSADRKGGYQTFLDSIVAAGVDALLITGDISTSTLLEQHVRRLNTDLPGMKIFFVLGNHDFWHGSILRVRAAVDAWTNSLSNVTYLTTRDPVALSSTTCLLGVDGWYDARAGNPHRLEFIMNDWRFIEEYKRLQDPQASHYMLAADPRSLIGASSGLADGQTNLLETKIETALHDGFKRIIIATHVPPFVEGGVAKSKRRNKREEEAYTPWYVNQSMGGMLTYVAKGHPHVNFDVFCGHSHEDVFLQKTPNLTMSVSHAQYGSPRVTRTIEAG